MEVPRRVFARKKNSLDKGFVQAVDSLENLNKELAISGREIEFQDRSAFV